METDKKILKQLGILMSSKSTQQFVFDEAEKIAKKASRRSGRNFKAVRSTNSQRAAAAVLPADPHAIASDNKHNHLIRSMD